MVTDQSKKLVFTANQDRKITILDIEGGKIVRSFLPSPKSDEDDASNAFVSNLAVHPTLPFIAAGTSDKLLKIIDYHDNRTLVQECGHADLMTGVSVIGSGELIITTTGDGCAYLWELIDSPSIANDQSITSTHLPPLPVTDFVIPGSEQPLEILNSPFVLNYDDAVLPTWARGEKNDADTNGSESLAIRAKGRWAERVDTSGIVLFSEIPTTEPPVAQPSSRRFSIDSSTSHAALEPLNLPTEKLVEKTVGLVIEDIEPKVHCVGDSEPLVTLQSMERISYVADYMEDDPDEEKRATDEQEVLVEPAETTSKCSSPIKYCSPSSSQSSPKRSIRQNLEILNRVADDVIHDLLRVSPEDEEHEEIMTSLNSLSTKIASLVKHPVDEGWIKDLLESYSTLLVQSYKERLGK